MHMVDSRNLSSWDAASSKFALAPMENDDADVRFTSHGAKGAPFTDLIDFNEAFTSGRASFHRP